MNHGVFSGEGQGGAQPITLGSTNFAVVIGTAPDADPAAFPLNEPVLLAGSDKLAAKLDTVGNASGTLPDAIRAVLDQHTGALAIIRVERGADDATTQANVIGGTDSATDKRTGMQAILNIQAQFGVRPRLLAAPGFTAELGVANALLTLANRLRCMAYIDVTHLNAAGTTYADAVAYKANFGDRRAELCWPPVINNAGREVPMSAYRLGLEMKKDATPGQAYSASASNQLLSGVTGLTYPIEYNEGDAACMANLLNGNRITTIINDDGWRLWGNLTCATEPKWQFANAVRVNDVIADAIQHALKWARDRKITKTFTEDVTDAVNTFLQNQTKAGNLYGGEAWADPELNTPTNIQAGQFYMDYDFTPPGIAQAINVTSHFTNKYGSAVFS